MREAPAQGEALLTALSSHTRSSSADPLFLAHKGQPYIFQRVTDQVVAGFRIHNTNFDNQFNTLITDAENELQGIQIQLTGWQDQTRNVHGEEFSRVKLQPPFQHLTLIAHQTDPDLLDQAARTETRLYFWGIFLLAFGITCGAILFIVQSSAEMRRARA